MAVIRKDVLPFNTFEPSEQTLNSLKDLILDVIALRDARSHFSNIVWGEPNKDDTDANALPDKADATVDPDAKMMESDMEESESQLYGSQVEVSDVLVDSLEQFLVLLTQQARTLLLGYVKDLLQATTIEPGIRELIGRMSAAKSKGAIDWSVAFDVAPPSELDVSARGGDPSTEIQKFWSDILTNLDARNEAFDVLDDFADQNSISVPDLDVPFPVHDMPDLGKIGAPRAIVPWDMYFTAPKITHIPMFRERLGEINLTPRGLLFHYSSMSMLISTMGKAPFNCSSPEIENHAGGKLLLSETKQVAKEFTLNVFNPCEVAARKCLAESSVLVGMIDIDKHVPKSATQNTMAKLGTFINEQRIIDLFRDSNLLRDWDGVLYAAEGSPKDGHRLQHEAEYKEIFSVVASFIMLNGGVMKAYVACTTPDKNGLLLMAFTKACQASGNRGPLPPQ